MRWVSKTTEGDTRHLVSRTIEGDSQDVEIPDLWINPKASRGSYQGPSVLVLVIDCLRRDHLSCYGYSRPTSPELDDWAARSLVFTEFTSTASWTSPSWAAMLYSNQELVQKFHSYGQGLPEGNWGPCINQFFQESVLISGSPAISGDSWGRAFSKVLFRSNVAAEQLLSLLVEVFQPEGNIYWVFLVDTHSPYTPRSFAGHFGTTHDFGQADEAERDLLYDEAIRYTSWAWGQVMLQFREAVVLITGDHGEFLSTEASSVSDSHWHPIGRQDSVVREVPFIFYAKEVSPGRSEESGTHLDIAPTLAQFLGLPGSDRWCGRALTLEVDPLTARLRALGY